MYSARRFTPGPALLQGRDRSGGGGVEKYVKNTIRVGRGRLACVEKKGFAICRGGGGNVESPFKRRWKD